MNKKVRKLQLNRETLRHLEGRDLQGIVGGATLGRCGTYTCPETVSCNWTECFSDQCSASGCPSGLTDCC